MPSGSERVVLPGAAMVPLVKAIAALNEAGIGRFAIIGGVAVTARLGQAHRATADVDTVVDETTSPNAVEALLDLPGAAPDPASDHRVLFDETTIEILGGGRSTKPNSTKFLPRTPCSSPPMSGLWKPPRHSRSSPAIAPT